MATLKILPMTRGVTAVNTAPLFVGMSLAVTMAMGASQNIETKVSDKPVSARQAEQQLAIRLPLPTSTENVRYSLAGSTQNWDLYLAFQAQLEDIKSAFEQELTSYKKRVAIAEVFQAEDYRRVAIHGTLGAIRTRAPSRWWEPSEIQSAYFIGSSHPHGYGPHFLVDYSHEYSILFRELLGCQSEN